MRATTRAYCLSSRSLRLPKILVKTFAILEWSSRPRRVRERAPERLDPAKNQNVNTQPGPTSPARRVQRDALAFALLLATLDGLSALARKRIGFCGTPL